VVLSGLEVVVKLSLGTESRKVVMFTVVFVVSTVFLWFGKIDPANWMELTKWLGLGIAAGLTAEHFAPKQV
jgi:hypothetical protein